jgi:hypothetical protein
MRTDPDDGAEAQSLSARGLADTLVLAMPLPELAAGAPGGPKV